MKHTLTISDLDDFEATHISEILHDYECKILQDIIKSIALKEDGHVEWYEKHLDWHKNIMKKIQWNKG